VSKSEVQVLSRIFEQTVNSQASKAVIQRSCAIAKEAEQAEARKIKL
jgi:hypothetical protein